MTERQVSVLEFHVRTATAEECLRISELASLHMDKARKAGNIAHAQKMKTAVVLFLALHLEGGGEISLYGSEWAPAVNADPTLRDGIPFRCLETCWCKRVALVTSPLQFFGSRPGTGMVERIG